MASIRRMTNEDHRGLIKMIQRYGIDGISLEIMMILKTWTVGSFRWQGVADASRKFHYHARLAMGKAIPLREMKE